MKIKILLSAVAGLLVASEGHCGFWAKTNQHMHTENSRYAWNRDVDFSTVDAVIRTYKARGYNVIAITDYNHVTACDAYTNLSERFICMGGTEVGYPLPVQPPPPATRAYLHLVQINIESFLPSQNTAQEAINRTNAQRGLAIIAHPDASWGTPVTTEDLMALQNYAAIEIVTNFSGAIPVWDQALLRGRKVFGVGSDDMHVLGAHMGSIWTKVYMVEFNKEAYFRSIQSGYAYVSTGPSMDEQPFTLTSDDQRSAHMGESIVGNHVSATAGIAPSVSGGKINTLQLIKNGELIVNKTDCPPAGPCTLFFDEKVTGPAYYRVYAIDSANKKIWSNPIWVNVRDNMPEK